MWYTIVTVIHIITCFFLATVVLLQTGKGSDVSAVFGGSSQTLFGSSGAGNLLTKLTSASAIVFMLTSLTLTYGAAKRSTRSIFDSAPVSTPAPTAPENAPAAQSETSPQSQITTTVVTSESAPPTQSGTSTASQAPETTSTAPTPAPTPSEQTASPGTSTPAAK